MSNDSGTQSGMKVLREIDSELSQTYDVDPATGLCFYGVDLTSIAAEFVSDMANSYSRVPVPTVHGGAIPGWVGEGTDVVLTSVSGDCEDVLWAYGRFRDVGARIHCLTSGGRLAQLCMADGNHLIEIPEGLDDAECFGQSIGALTGLVDDLGLADVRGLLRDEVSRCIAEGILVDDATKVAEALFGNTSAVYSTSDIRSCSMWWRYRMYSFGPSFWAELPEYDHNELVGWSDPNVHAPELRMVILRGSASKGLVSRIVDSMREVLRINGRAVSVLNLDNGNVISRNLRGIMYAEEVHGLMEGME